MRGDQWAGRRMLNGVVNPFELSYVLWPDSRYHAKQEEVVWSVEHNHVTMVPAGNMLGKDWIAGRIVVSHFLRYPVVRVVTTSVKDDHLRVLWGEIGRAISESRVPLTVDRGGPIRVLHRDLRKVTGGVECEISYVRGMVSERGEGMAGHHAPWTLGVIDEASGVDDLVFTQMETWARRILVIGNPNPTVNFFYQGVKAGDLRATG